MVFAALLGPVGKHTLSLTAHPVEVAVQVRVPTRVSAPEAVAGVQTNILLPLQEGQNNIYLLTVYLLKASAKDAIVNRPEDLTVSMCLRGQEGVMRQRPQRP